MRTIIGILQRVLYTTLTVTSIFMFMRLVNTFLPTGTVHDTLTAIIIWFLAYTVTSIIHESGHLVGGLIDGYSFLLFQVLCFRITKYRENVVFNVVNNAKSQCVMVPDDNKEHWNTYIMMGLVFNIITTLAAAFAGMYIGENGWEFILLFAMAATGMCKIAANGIPYFKSNNPGNDCAMFILLNLDELLREEFFLYLKCYSRYINDFSIGIIPELSIEPGKHYSSIFRDEINRIINES